MELWKTRSVSYLIQLIRLIQLVSWSWGRLQDSRLATCIGRWSTWPGHHLVHPPLWSAAMTCHSLGRKLIFTILHVVSWLFKDVNDKIKSLHHPSFFLALIKRRHLVFLYWQKEGVWAQILVEDQWPWGTCWQNGSEWNHLTDLLSESWWWMGRPGMLRFMGSQIRTWLSDWTELNWSFTKLTKVLEQWPKDARHSSSRATFSYSTQGYSNLKTKRIENMR